MPFDNSGPFNCQQGNSINIGVEFFDTSGFPTVPPSAIMRVVYTNTSNVTQTDNVTLFLVVGSYFEGTWSSTSAALGLATWTAIALPSSVQAKTGQFRIVQRRNNN